MSNGEGSKYLATKTLRTAEIAKLIRADIKAAIKAGQLPAGTKCSVTTDTFSGGSSIDIRVKACPVQIWTEAFLASDPNRFFEGERVTAEAKAVLATLKQIHRSYNFDHSDIQSDYFHVRYYGDASFCWELEKADRERTIARKVTETKAAAVEAQADVAAIDARIAELEAKQVELEARAAEAAARVEQARAEAFDAAMALYIARAEAAASVGCVAGVA